VKDDSLAWIAEEEAIALLKKSRNSLYSNSENALAWIDHYGESELSGQLQVLKIK
jgi:hypothetical protein